MFKNIQIPASFSLIEKGKVSLLLKEEHKNLLLAQGIGDLKTFLKKRCRTAHYLKGRTLHPSIPFRDGMSMVLRRYSHGGLLRAITGNLYFFGARSFRELALTEEIRSCGVPTISFRRRHPPLRLLSILPGLFSLSGNPPGYGSDAIF